MIVIYITRLESTLFICSLHLPALTSCLHISIPKLLEVNNVSIFFRTGCTTMAHSLQPRQPWISVFTVIRCRERLLWLTLEAIFLSMCISIAIYKLVRHFVPLVTSVLDLWQPWTWDISWAYSTWLRSSPTRHFAALLKCNQRVVNSPHHSQATTSQVAIVSLEGCSSGS